MAQITRDLGLPRSRPAAARPERRWWGPVPATVLVVVVAAAGAAWLYAGAVERGATLAATAEANARAVVRVEQALGIHGVTTLARGPLGSGASGAAAAAVYSLAYWPFLGGALLALGWRDRARLWRPLLAVATSGLVGVVAMTAFPTAPPRLMGFTDVVAGSPWAGVAHPDTVLNPFGAMPSFHVAWSLLAAAGLAAAARSRLARLAAWVQPVLMSAAVVLTANHWVLDVLAGAALAAAAWWTAPPLLRLIGERCRAGGATAVRG